MVIFTALEILLFLQIYKYKSIAIGLTTFLSLYVSEYKTQVQSRVIIIMSIHSL